jgi:hypothetical protein
MQFRSGALTRIKLNRLLAWIERMPHDLKRAARASGFYPTDVITWFAAGQDPDCRNPLYAELAWRVAEIRGEKSAENYARLEALAAEGDFRAIEKIEEKADASLWEISPDNEQAEELSRVLRSAEPTPLLPAGAPDEAVLIASEGISPSPEPLDLQGTETCDKA